MKDSKNVPFTSKSQHTNGNNSNAINTPATLNSIHLQNHNQAIFQGEIDISTANNTHRTFLNQSKKKNLNLIKKSIVSNSKGTLKKFYRSKSNCIINNMSSYTAIVNKFLKR